MYKLLGAVVLLANVGDASAAAAPIPVRTPIASLPVTPAKPVTHVEMMRVDFAPGQEMPRHTHPVPVVCFVIQGRLLASIGNDPLRTVQAGDATIEPAGAIVNFFRNLSASEPAQLDCAILAGPDDKQYSVMLDK
jgi:quercetin dioxygenase-like cupin family protein